MEDAKILDLYFARDEDAIRETDTAYGKRLHTLAKNILQNREDAEESVNDTYAEVWKSIPPRRPKYFFAFLASICRHLSLNRVDWKQAAKRAPRSFPSPRRWKTASQIPFTSGRWRQRSWASCWTYFWKVCQRTVA